MKKWILGFVVAAGVMVGSVWFYDNCYLPEFEILGTIKVGADKFDCVYLTVQVNRWCYDTDDVMQEVKEHYCNLNGVPDKLEINLFGCKLNKRNNFRW